MPPLSPSPNGELLKELVSSFTEMMRSEMNLARAELRDSAHRAQQGMRRIALLGIAAMLGVLPLTAFLVIGLGRLLNNNYWLSSLIVGIVLSGGGGLAILGTLRSIREENFNLPETRESVSDEVEHMQQKVSQITQSARESARRKSA